MDTILAPHAQARLSFYAYRYRFLLLYVLFGVGSIAIEIALLHALEFLGLAHALAAMLGLGIGILAAYWLNVNLNFKVPLAKRRRALLYFAGISLLSVSFNFLFNQQLVARGWSYDRARFVVSGVLFSFAYLLHRRFSFVDRKQVGVAVYANGLEDIFAIREKILDFPDFIHVDLIDESFGTQGRDVRAYRLEAIKALWPTRKIHVHLMTRHPLRWLPEILPFADLILIHAEIDDPLGETLACIRSAGRQAGLCLRPDTDPESAKPWLSQLKVLMLLTIDHPGLSGQAFRLQSLDTIQRINAWPERRQFSLCIDGGVNERNIQLLNTELVVSGSAVLQAPSPRRQIMRLQTSSNHEAV